MDADSTTRTTRRGRASDRPKKPYKDFPLSPHPSGYWQKKIRGKIHYFGRWGHRRQGVVERIDGDGWEEALRLYKAQADDLHAGRVPRSVDEDALTVADLCNKFMNFKADRFECGRIAKRTFDEYFDTCGRIVEAFGKTRAVDDLSEADFQRLWRKLAERYGPMRMGNEVTRVRSVFKYGRKSDLVPPEFEKPSRAELRRHKAKTGKRLFSAEQIRTLLEEASVPMRAMIYLGINAGLGNSDVANLERAHLDTASSLLDYPREKTGVDRRAALWPETLAAIEAVLADRPTPLAKADADLVFVTVHGNRWVRSGNERHSVTNAVGLEFGKLMRRCKIVGPKGLGFYSLRHTFRTVADRTKDFPAVRLAMGHADDSIDATYREQIEDERLRSVADQVRCWLLHA